MSLDDLEKKLYSRKKEEVKRSFPPSLPATEETEVSPIPVKESWTEVTDESAGESPAKSSHFKKIAVIMMAVLAIVVVGAGILILGSNRNSQSVDLTIIGPQDVYRGVPFEVEVQMNNQMDSFLSQGNLTINLPNGVAYMGGLNGETSIVTESVGDVGSGSFVKKTFKFLPIGLDNSVQKFNFVFSYGAGGRTRFETAKTQEVAIKGPGITLEVDKPDHVLSGSTFELNVHYRNVSGYDFSDVNLEAKYPSSFKFISSSLVPDSLNSYWRLGELKTGSKGDLQIKGSLQGTEEGRFAVPMTIYASFLGKDYKIVDQLVNVALAPSPVALEISLNNRSDYVPRIGDKLHYIVKYQNNSGIALADVIVKASLAGELFDFTTLGTDANVDSVNNTLTWNASKVPNLRLLEAGGSGELEIGIDLKKQFPIRRIGDKNFVLRLNVELDSPSVPYYLQASKTSAVAALETKISGMTIIDTQAFYRDAQAGMINKGNFPPRVNQATEYTIHWIIRNYGTDAKNVEIKAALQSGVVWTGMVKSNIDSVPLWNERTGEIVWNIEKIPATKGIISDPVEAVFQVRATPDVTQVGGFQPLIGETSLKATDDFTGQTLDSSDAGISTALPDDRTVGQDGGKVMP
jgi:hypothetical protein